MGCGGSRGDQGAADADGLSAAALETAKQVSLKTDAVVANRKAVLEAANKAEQDRLQKEMADRLDVEHKKMVAELRDAHEKQIAEEKIRLQEEFIRKKVSSPRQDADAQAALQKQLQASRAECEKLRLSSQDLQKSHRDLVKRLDLPQPGSAEKSKVSKDLQNPGELERSQKQKSQEIKELQGKLTSAERISAESTQKCVFLEKRTAELDETLKRSMSASQSPGSTMATGAVSEALSTARSEISESPRRHVDMETLRKELKQMEEAQRDGYDLPRSDIQDATSVNQSCGGLADYDTMGNFKLCARAVFLF